MTPEEVIQKFKNNLDIFDKLIIDDLGYNEDQIIHLMVEYAHLMCEKQKQICADNAKLDIISNGELPSYWYDVSLNKESILQSPNATEV